MCCLALASEVCTFTMAIECMTRPIGSWSSLLRFRHRYAAHETIQGGVGHLEKLLAFPFVTEDLAEHQHLLFGLCSSCSFNGAHLPNSFTRSLSCQQLDDKHTYYDEAVVVASVFTFVDPRENPRDDSGRRATTSSSDARTCGTTRFIRNNGAFRTTIGSIGKRLGIPELASRTTQETQ